MGHRRLGALAGLAQRRLGAQLAGLDHDAAIPDRHLRQGVDTAGKTARAGAGPGWRGGHRTAAPSSLHRPAVTVQPIVRRRPVAPSKTDRWDRRPRKASNASARSRTRPASGPYSRMMGRPESGRARKASISFPRSATTYDLALATSSFLMCNCTSGDTRLRVDPESRSNNLWIPGSRYARPGMTGYNQVPATKNDASRVWMFSAISLAARSSASRNARAREKRWIEPGMS